jgi:flagellar basal body-associated protein FliL
MKGKIIVFIIILFIIAALGLAWYLLWDVIENYNLDLKEEAAKSILQWK